MVPSLIRAALRIHRSRRSEHRVFSTVSGDVSVRPFSKLGGTLRELRQLPPRGSSACSDGVRAATRTLQSAQQIRSIAGPPQVRLLGVLRDNPLRGERPTVLLLPYC